MDKGSCGEIISIAPSIGKTKLTDWLIVKRQSWRLFFSKATIVITVIFVFGLVFFSRFKIVGDPQEVKCIPGYTVYLVDTKNKEIKRDGLYMFLSKDLSPFYKKNTQMLKYLRALPGDEVVINGNDQIFINGKAGEWGLSLAEEKMNVDASKFHGKIKLGDDQFWFLGTSPRSFDSRYWGAVKSESIVGRAYPLI